MILNYRAFALTSDENASEDSFFYIYIFMRLDDESGSYGFIVQKKNPKSFVNLGLIRCDLFFCYNPNNTCNGSFPPKIILSGFSNISFTFTRKPTDSFPSIIR